MSYTTLDSQFTYGDWPTIDASPIALEAGTDQSTAEAMISAAWAQVEAFTGRSYRGTLTGVVLVKTVGNVMFKWPRYPYPDAITAEIYCGGWGADTGVKYLAGEADLEGFSEYRLTQTGTVTANPAGAHVLQAVRNLALYQLIQGPARREFKSQNAGDTGFTRESLMGVFYGSGAGALLAGEVRK